MDDLLIALRAVISLAAVLGLLLWVTHHVKKRQTNGTGSRTTLPPALGKLTRLVPLRSERRVAAAKPERITVVARSGLAGKAQLVVAEFGGIRYILGVTEHGVSVVDTQEPAPEWDEATDGDDSDASVSTLKPVA